MHTLKLQYLISLLHVYNWIGKPVRESIKKTLVDSCKDIFSVHTISLIISLGISSAVFIYTWVFVVVYYGRGMYVEGGLLGLASMGLLWVMAEECKLWRSVCEALRWRDCG